MKTTMKQFTAIAFIAFLLVIGNVNAKGTETKTLLKESIETKLELEGWMTDESVWNANQESFIEFTEELEPEMQFESWMIDNENWGIENKVEKTDEKLTIENWMLSENVWNR